jgi:hypothetical protein
MVKARVTIPVPPAADVPEPTLTAREKYSKTKEDTRSMWELTFRVCQLHLTQVEQGKTKLSGSLLTQICSVLRQAKEHLHDMMAEVEVEEKALVLQRIVESLPIDENEACLYVDEKREEDPMDELKIPEPSFF